MTTRISCKVTTEYLKAHDDVGPRICVIVQPTLWELIKGFWAWLTGQTWCFYHEFTDSELTKQAEDLRHWYLVKSLRGYKHRAK